MKPERITDWRAARGWTKAEAARRTGTHVNSWAAWEAGKRAAPDWLGFVLRAVGDALAPYR
jgi:transcriptional regulator with XRE-family HTH domain